MLANTIWGDDMNKMKKYIIFFVVGGICYAAIEMLWRGYTHWSMVIAGGVCFMIFSLIASKFENKPLILKAIVCALCVTAVEFVFGLVFNIMLGMKVWDYSQMPYNVCGQICLTFSLMWVGLGIIFIPVADMLNKNLNI